VAVALGLLAFIAYFVTPWPSVWVLRAIFDAGASSASAKLEKHLPQGIVTREAINYDPTEPGALLDIYSPSRASTQAPTIVWVHGGGFATGRRGDITNYLKVLAGRGFVTVSVDYTLAPTANFPGPVRQVSRALTFLSREGARLGVNPNAMVIAGDSAGAQIAAQIANVVTSPAYARELGVVEPIAAERLKGALLYCGVYDITQLNHEGGILLRWLVQTVTWAYSGKRDWHQAQGFDRISVIPDVTSHFPPAFISAGNIDPLRPQSVLMAAALRKVSVPVETLFYSPDHEPKLGHEYQFDLNTRDGQVVLDRSVAWLSRLGK
jgi:acetyl esterase/lipase